MTDLSFELVKILLVLELQRLGTTKQTNKTNKKRFFWYVFCKKKQSVCAKAFVVPSAVLVRPDRGSRGFSSLAVV